MVQNIFLLTLVKMKGGEIKPAKYLAIAEELCISE